MVFIIGLRGFTDKKTWSNVGGHGGRRLPRTVAAARLQSWAEVHGLGFNTPILRIAGPYEDDIVFYTGFQ